MASLASSGRSTAMLLRGGGKGRLEPVDHQEFGV